MSASLEDYREVSPPGSVEFLRRLSEKLRGRTLLQVNASRITGGVAEILARHTPLLQELGIDARWETIEGGPGFEEACLAFYNALQGDEQRITEAMLREFVTTNRVCAQSLSLAGDVVVVHDPQPAPLVDFRPTDGRWVWRCHLDIARPHRKTWAFFRQFVVKYDAAVFTLPKFAQRLPIPQFLIHPSIDPLSERNRELSEGEIARVLDRLQVPRDKPILL